MSSARFGIIIRVHRVDETTLAFARRLRAESGYNVWFFADERNAAVADVGDFEKVSLTSARAEERGLYLPRDAGWRCGDYAFYLSMERFPDIEFFWLVEYDIRIRTSSYGDFFRRFDLASEDDFLAVAYGPANESWSWRARISPYVDRVFCCLFPLCRLSRRAAAVLLAERQAISAEFLQGERDWNSYPNDEAFVASHVARLGFTARDLNDFGRKHYSEETFSINRPFLLAQVERLAEDDMIYHPVLEGRAFAGKAEWYLERARRREDLERFHAYLIEHGQAACEAATLARLRRIAEARLDAGSAALEGLGTPVSQAEFGQLQRWNIAGRQVSWIIGNRSDYIQAVLASGSFYEGQELGVLRAIWPRLGTFVDIGANVGNHSIFAGHFMQPSRIICIEPLRQAYELLVANLALNFSGSATRFEAKRLALGREPGSGFVSAPRNNLGMATISASSGEAVEICTGDLVLQGEAVDLIKLDVRGAEMDVLPGLGETIAENRPGIYVAVHERNAGALAEWREAHGYRVVWSFPRYPKEENMILLPVEKELPEGVASRIRRPG